MQCNGAEPATSVLKGTEVLRKRWHRARMWYIINDQVQWRVVKVDGDKEDVLILKIWPDAPVALPAPSSHRCILLLVAFHLLMFLLQW